MNGLKRFAVFLVVVFVSSAPLLNAQTADKILVLKKQREMTLLKDNKVLRQYRISLGSAPEGAKEREGDHRTPEGTYKIDSRNANSRFHRALHISYPNQSDLQRAKKLRARPGGNIMIHGLPNGYGWVRSIHRLGDWTDGCIAVTNAEIEEIWRLVPNGTTIEIRP